MSKKMSRQEFQDSVHEIAGQKLIDCGFGKKAIWEDLKVLEMKWRTGGASGGDCWGGEAVFCNDGEPIPEFDDFDNLLTEVVPYITFLQYKSLTRLIETDTEHENDYYGNYDVYAVKRIEIEKIWEFLCNHGIIDEADA